MMQIGDITFKTKKEALTHFRQILNSYNFGDKLTTEDLKDILQLLRIHEKSVEKIGCGVKKVVIKEVRFKTKCFNLIRIDGSSEIISYTKCINGSYNPLTKFSKTCRDLISDDLRNVKLKFFKQNSIKGYVSCQETGELCSWEELNVDHRQPNTFSVIIDRFIEVNCIDINKVEYIEIIDSVYMFKDVELGLKFKEYHKNKANLRIVKKKMNLGRSYQARLSRQKKDLTIT